METGRERPSASVGSVAISRFLGVSQLPPYVRRVIPPSKKPFLGLGIKWILGFLFVLCFFCLFVFNFTPIGTCELEDLGG